MVCTVVPPRLVDTWIVFIGRCRGIDNVSIFVCCNLVWISFPDFTNYEFKLFFPL